MEVKLSTHEEPSIDELNLQQSRMNEVSKVLGDSAPNTHRNGAAKELAAYRVPVIKSIDIQKIKQSSSRDDRYPPISTTGRHSRFQDSHSRMSSSIARSPLNISMDRSMIQSYRDYSSQLNNYEK